MYSIGEFREGEIDGKPFHIYTTFSSSSFSGGDDVSPPQPLYICQSFRSSFHWKDLRKEENDANCEEFVPVDDYPQFFNKRRDYQQFEPLVADYYIYYHRCKLPLVPLFWCNNKDPDHPEFSCGVCDTSDFVTDYLFCVTCDKMFHKECIECPLEIKHPSFPFLPLKLYYPPESSNLMICSCCQKLFKNMLFYCPTYKLTLHPVCAMKPIPILLDHPKRHPHPLTLFPRQAFLPCNICGLINETIPTYVCARCVFVVHQDCIYSPYVIKISRHQHRISFTYSLPSGKLSCGVCRRKVDNNYGAYSCNKCDGYFVHTKCALRRDLWDGKELEGVPEEPEEVVEPPFKRISDGIILHFSHGHRMKLEISKVYDEDLFCQACVLPIYEGNYYTCMHECKFIIHEACASEPRKKQHALWAHPLTLKVVTNEYDDGNGSFNCDACSRTSCGFVYEHSEENSRAFQLDSRCASVSEPFKYEGHEHPLFLALTLEEEHSAICQICQGRDRYSKYRKKLNCIECSFVICFVCATLPYKARYKHDKHFLTFREKEEASSDDNPGWCDKCEGKIVYSRKGGFYSCDDNCSTTVHVDCLLGGEDFYMKRGQTFRQYLSGDKVHILGNKTMSRPFCHVKEHRCPKKRNYIEINSCNFDYCSTTLHVDCLLGEDLYLMKPGQTLKSYRGEKVLIIRNKTMSRPFCHGKEHRYREHRCPHNVVFKNNNMTFCSFSCVLKFIE